MSSTTPIPRGFPTIRDSQSGITGNPGFICFPVHQGSDSSSKHRGRRNRSLSPTKKLKIARVRKTGACLRCQILRVKCDEERPCQRCKAAIESSNRPVGLKWMDCTVVSLVEWSIYKSNPSPVQTSGQPYAKTLSSMLDEIRHPLELEQEFTLDFLAQDFAAWIIPSGSGVAASKLGLLCISDFQAIAAGVVQDFSISNFRLLIWTTTLVFTARCRDGEDRHQQIDALCNLKKFRNWCGEIVVNELDRLCRPQSLQQLTTLQHKLLFVVVIGVCLSASYAVDISSNSIACPSVSNEALDPKHRTFIRALAHIGTYLGHVTSLLDPRINFRALLDAADRRWDKEGSYSWLLPCSLVEKLQTELSGSVFDEQIRTHSPVPLTLYQASDKLEDAVPSTTVPTGGSENLCPSCHQKVDIDFCIWCEFTTFPEEEDEITVQFGGIPTIFRGANLVVDMPKDDEQEKPYRSDLSSRTIPPGHPSILIEPIHSREQEKPYRSDLSSRIILTSHYSFPIESTRSGRLLWYCHECGDGPKNIFIQPGCVMCDHVACEDCDFGDYTFV